MRKREREVYVGDSFLAHNEIIFIILLLWISVGSSNIFSAKGKIPAATQGRLYISNHKLKSLTFGIENARDTHLFYYGPCLHHREEET